MTTKPWWSAWVLVLALTACVDPARLGGFECDTAGRCKAPEGTCGAQSCAGCCEGTTCLAGAAPTACGVGGAACAACTAGQGCVAGTCAEVKAIGAACAFDRECGSSHCAAGLCCESACSGGCETCAASGSEGRCTVAPATATCGEFRCDGSARACPTACTSVAQCAPGRACSVAAGSVCVDVDECATPGVCGVDALCANTPEAFECACPPGFLGAATTGTATTCTDVNECSTAGVCGVHASCTNTPGSWECACDTGYFGASTTGGPATCGLVNNCSAASCGALATCQSSGSTFDCTCLGGYTGTPTTGAPPICADTDECLTAGLCGPDALCANTPGSFACTCKPGFTGASTSGGAATCADVNECGTPGVCGANAHCTNTPAGSFTCACDGGFFGATTVGAPTFCATVDRCGTPGQCGANATCAITPTSYSCTCAAGFTGATTTGAAATCVDTNECATAGLCGLNAGCANTPGSYDCACLAGFSGASTSGAPATCVSTLVDLGSTTGTTSTVKLTLTKPVPAGATVIAVASIAGNSSGLTDTRANSWTVLVSSSPCAPCGTTSIYRARLTTALAAGDVLTLTTFSSNSSALWAVWAPAYPYLDIATPISGNTTTTLPSVATLVPVTEPDELLVGGFTTESQTTLVADGGFVETVRYSGNQASGLIAYRIASGLSGAQALVASSSTAQRFSGAIAAFYGGAQVAPSSLTLTHTPNARAFTVGWVGGRGNGGPLGCRVQVTTATGTVNATPSVNCDVPTSAQTVNLPSTANWYGGAWASATVRLVRFSDGAVLGTFPAPVTCVGKTAASAATPTVDENCDGTWDDHTCTSFAWVAGTIFAAPTYTVCTNSTGYSAGATACTAAVEATTRYTDGPLVGLGPSVTASSDSYGTGCTGAFQGAVTWRCTGSGCAYR